MEGFHSALLMSVRKRLLLLGGRSLNQGLICAFEVVLGLLMLPVNLLFGSLWNLNASSLNPSASPLGRAESVPCFFSYI